jgi:alpha-L-fucosidase
MYKILVALSLQLYISAIAFGQQAFIYGDMQRSTLTKTDPGYRHAPPDAVERWKDWKFGLRIHWGLYSMMGSDASWALPFSSPEFRQIYGTRYQFFDPTEFDAAAWMQLMSEAGIKYFTFTTKHHDGFSMWATKTVRESLRLTPKGIRSGKGVYETRVIPYSIMDTPFHRDVLAELVTAARQRGLGISLYYSHIDWQDPAFAWDPYNLHYDAKLTKQSDPVRWGAFIQQERRQVQELLTQYGRIDALEFDIGWPKEAAADVAALARMSRDLQPRVLLRNRGIGAYGDMYTPEREIPPGFQPGSPWQEIYPGGEAFSYLPNDVYKPAEWIVHTLVDVVAKGGNFEVGYGPMPSGRFPEEAVTRLRAVGKWLSVNGEAIYGSRPYSTFQEGDDVRFTRSKDGRTVYAISLKWPGDTFRTKLVKPGRGADITLLGSQAKLAWHREGRGVVVEIPGSLQEKHPCDYAWVFRIRNIEE